MREILIYFSFAGFVNKSLNMTILKIICEAFSVKENHIGTQTDKNYILKISGLVYLLTPFLLRFP